MIAAVLLSIATSMAYATPPGPPSHYSVTWRAPTEIFLDIEKTLYGKMVLSSDGTTLATPHSRMAQVWDVASGRLKDTFHHERGVRYMAFSPDGAILATTSLQGKILLWNVDTGQVQAVLEDTTTVGGAMAFSPDGFALAQSTDKGINLWDMVRGELITALEDSSGHDHSILVYSPDGSLLASLSNEGVRLWNLSRGQLMTTLPVWTAEVPFRYASTVAFTPDGSMLATSEGMLWDLHGGPSGRVSIPPYGDTRAVTFSPDGSQLAIGSSDEVAIWGVGGQWKAILATETWWNVYTSLIYSPDGTRLFGLLSGPSFVFVWDVTPRMEVTVTVEDPTGGPVEGMIVEFSRSISGRRSNFVWSAVVDTQGRAELPILATGKTANGFYLARVLDEKGTVRGFRGSIPLNEGRRHVVKLSLVDTTTTRTVLGSPNPFNDFTQISYRLAESGRVRLEIYNVLGQRVRTLVDEVQRPGHYRAEWNGRDAHGRASGSGLYLYHLVAGGRVHVGKLALIR